MTLSWQLHGDLAELVRREALGANVRLAARLSMLVLFFGLGFWLLALWVIPFSLPQHVTLYGYLVFLGLAVAPWLLPLLSLQKRTYRLTRWGVRFGMADVQWRTCLAYSIASYPGSDRFAVLMLWRKWPAGHTSCSVPLPDDDRLRRLILRYVARHLPRLDQCDNADEIRKPLPGMPRWFEMLWMPLAMLYSMLIGIAMWLLRVNVGIEIDWLMLVTFIGVFLHPGWIAAWLLARTGTYRRIRQQLYASAVATGLIAWLLGLFIFALFMVSHH